MNHPVAAEDVEAKASSSYPTAALRAPLQGRTKRALGDVFGLVNFGVNYTTLPPGAASALQHYHSHQDEFVYVLQGTATCQWGQEEEFEIGPGQCMGFPKGRRVGHCIVNKSKDTIVVYLEIGDRSAGDYVEYPKVDLICVEDEEGNGGKKHKFLHKDGTPYEVKDQE